MKTKQQIEAVMAGLREALINDKHDEADQRVAYAMESILYWIVSRPKVGDDIDDQSNIERAVEIATINAQFIRKDFAERAALLIHRNFKKGRK